MIKEAIVLDKLKKDIKFKQTEVIHCISTSNFSLLEIITDAPYKQQEKINTIELVVRRIMYSRLSSEGKKELEKAIETIVIENPTKYINFYNTAKPIGLRRHQLDLLPMIGIKHRMAIIEHIKKKGKFTSFEDIKAIDLMPDPVKVIVNRVIEEIMGENDIKFNLFTIPYQPKK